MARVVTNLSTIPAGTTGAGTVSCATVDGKHVVGAGTAFLTLFKGIVEPWIFFRTTKELRKVAGVISDTSLILEQPVSVAVTANNFDAIENRDNYSYSATVLGAAAADIDGATAPQGFTLNEGEVYIKEYMQRRNPIYVDGTGTQVRIVDGLL